MFYNFNNSKLITHCAYLLLSRRMEIDPIRIVQKDTLSPLGIFIILLCILLGSLLLGLIALLLQHMYRRVRTLIAVRRLQLPVGEYPPEGRQHEEDSAYARCAICQYDFTLGQKVATVSCGHLFHPQCIHGGLRADPRCPQCRVDLV